LENSEQSDEVEVGVVDTSKEQEKDNSQQTKTKKKT
jgi:hypothetical protein